MPPWIKALVLRESRWLVLDKGTFPVKKGEYIRMRGQRDVYEVMEDSKMDPDGGITIHSHKVGVIKE